MDLLIFSQTVYYFVFSFAIIVLGVLFTIIAYHLIHTIRHLRNISDTFDDTSAELKKRIEEIFERLSSFPILSYFLKKDGKRTSRESHKNSRTV